jgi:hypothetical protein
MGDIQSRIFAIQDSSEWYPVTKRCSVTAFPINKFVTIDHGNTYEQGALDNCGRKHGTWKEYRKTDEKLTTIENYQQGDLHGTRIVNCHNFGQYDGPKKQEEVWNQGTKEK